MDRVLIKKSTDGVAEHYVAIQITDEDKALANSIEQKLPKPIPSSRCIPIIFTQCSIFRVRENLRNINRRAYTPERVSIGPFHHGEGSLAAMEGTKLRYAAALFSRATPTRKSKLAECVAHIKKIEVEARECYSEPIQLSRKKFVEMMVIDGLFMIELFRKRFGDVEIERDDPIFGFHGCYSSLIHDLVLLENQLPWVVLHRLFGVLGLKEELRGITSIGDLSLKFFDNLELNIDSCVKYPGEEKHLLHLLHQTFRSPSHEESMECKIIYGWNFVPSVTELKCAGVKFARKHSRSTNLLEIGFKNGVMKIPTLTIRDQTDKLLRNLIAYEQHCGGNMMASYALIMENLIRSEEDVSILENKGIIVNHLAGGRKDVVTLFSQLCSEVTINYFLYHKLSSEVNRYYKSRRARFERDYIATLRRDYFKTPWAVISLMGALLLLILTLTQTLYAVLSYNKSYNHLW